MGNHTRILLKGGKSAINFRQGQTLQEIEAILKDRLGNSNLNKEMSFAQQGPKMTENIGAVSD